MRIETQFESRIAAEVWDARIRWRTDGRLRDVTVDDTWRRTASALVSAGGGAQAGIRASAYAHDFARWRLLADAELLARAGTQAPFPESMEPHALVNCAAFTTPRGAGGLPDWQAFAATARLAVWLVDDALALTGVAPERAWVGLCGLGDAFARMGMDYAAPDARRLAVRFAAVLAAATAEASLQLALERGPRYPASPPALDRWRDFGMGEEQLASTARHGMRLGRLTRISPAPTIAALAGTSDALFPAPAWSPETPSDALRLRTVRELHMAVQPWIDHEISTAA